MGTATTLSTILSTQILSCVTFALFPTVLYATISWLVTSAIKLTDFSPTNLHCVSPVNFKDVFSVQVSPLAKCAIPLWSILWVPPKGAIAVMDANVTHRNHYLTLFLRFNTQNRNAATFKERTPLCTPLRSLPSQWWFWRASRLVWSESNWLECCSWLFWTWVTTYSSICIWVPFSVGTM